MKGIAEFCAYLHDEKCCPDWLCSEQRDVQYVASRIQESLSIAIWLVFWQFTGLFSVLTLSWYLETLTLFMQVKDNVHKYFLKACQKPCVKSSCFHV